MKTFLFAFFFAAWVLPACAQDENIDTFRYRQNGLDIEFQAVIVKSNAELRQIELFDAMYPVNIVPQPVLHKAIRIGNRQSILADSLQVAIQELEFRSKLNDLEIGKKDRIIEYQKQFIAFSDSTNQLLNKSIGALNMQLTECRQVATAANKQQSGGKLLGILIGSGIGFGIGVLLGIIAN
jgi:hypothetical protein